MAAQSFNDLFGKFNQSNDEYARHLQYRTHPQMFNGRPTH